MKLPRSIIRVPHVGLHEDTILWCAMVLEDLVRCPRSFAKEQHYRLAARYLRGKAGWLKKFREEQRRLREGQDKP